jgi:low temperature requirement protein LtrA
MATADQTRRPLVSAVMREGEQVKPLELFFDLVFVLAITQCTALMADQPTWEGLAKGLLVLALLWWTWCGYAWLTSVVDPDEGAVRIAIFAAMAALLVIALCVPRAFDDLALTFAVAYGAVRAAHIALFVIASREDRELRRSVNGLAVSTAMGVGLILFATAFDGATQGAIWAVALALDYGLPYFVGTEGWSLVPQHFAERHGLIMIIALGESIVAIGIGAGADITAGVVTAAVLGIVLVAMMWWAYFDVVALVAARRLASIESRRERNAMARDSYSYLHLPMVAGVVLLALGLKTTLAHVDDPLEIEIAVALLGGFSLYLLAHVAFRLRNVHSLNRRRLVVAALTIALIPLALEIASLATLAILTGIACALIAYEAIRYADARDRVRHELATSAAAPGQSG